MSTDNGISLETQRYIASKVSGKMLRDFLSGKIPEITSSGVAVELLKETGYPVDGKDFSNLLVSTLCMFIERYHKHVGG